jgi:putative transposase
VKAEHPCWGDRRLWASRRFVDQRPVNKKRRRRRMRAHHLLVTPHPRVKAQRTPMRSTPKPTQPNAWGGIDMTKGLGQGRGWVDIVVVLDGYPEGIVGSSAGIRGTAQHWRAALEVALNRQFPAGGRGQALSLRGDNGCQPTSVACMNACSTLGVDQAFTRDHNPQGHADTERLIRTLKEECLWRPEWPCPLARFEALTRWINQDNERAWHSTLGDKPPRQFEREYHSRHGTQLPAA